MSPNWLNYESWKTQRWKTAIRRRKLSRPVQAALYHQIIQPEQTILDYGCGRGDDVQQLQNQGFTIKGCDPYWFPETTYDPAEVVFLNFVLNTIEDAEERPEVVHHALTLASKYLIVAIRTDGTGEVFTKAKTFQLYQTHAEAQTLLKSVIGRSGSVRGLKDPKTNRPDGIFVIEKPRRLSIVPSPSPSKPHIKTISTQLELLKSSDLKLAA